MVVSSPMSAQAKGVPATIQMPKTGAQSRGDERGALPPRLSFVLATAVLGDVLPLFGLQRNQLANEINAP